MRLLIILSFLYSFGFAQNYLDYHRCLNRIQMDILDSSFEVGLYRFDTIYREFEFIFAKDCFKALQLAIVVNDSGKMELWFEKCLRQGVPVWYLEFNRITASYCSTFDSTMLNNKYHQYQISYLEMIDQKIRSIVDSLIDLDQYYTNKVNDGFWPFRETIYLKQWSNNNKRQFPVLQDIIKNKGFPGEKLIGLDINDDSLNRRYYEFMGPLFGQWSAEIMLIHCYSRPMEEMNELLKEEIVKGNLTPKEFGIINDFIAKYGKGKCRLPEYYNVWHKDPDLSHMESINTRRHEVGLLPFEIQQEIRAILVDLRKNKKIHDVISLY